LLDPLSSWDLATHLDIPVRALSEFQTTVPVACHQLGVTDVETFSALTILHASRRLIVHNDAHSAGRQNSNICHELAHGLLMHPATAALNDCGCRLWNPEIEEEADWLAGVLLITDAIALNLVRGKIETAEAAVEYGVSRRMIEWRINVSGARIRISRANHKRY